MRKIIQIAVDAEGYLNALCDDGSVWYQHDVVIVGGGGKIKSEWRTFIDIPQDDTQEQQSDVIDAGIQEHKEGCEAYSLPIGKIMKDIETDQAKLSEDSEEYKDLQYLLEMLDLCWGVTDLCGSGYNERVNNLHVSQNILNNKTVMI